jgi:hypothetical protein
MPDYTLPAGNYALRQSVRGDRQFVFSHDVDYRYDEVHRKEITLSDSLVPQFTTASGRVELAEKERQRKLEDAVRKLAYVIERSLVANPDRTQIPGDIELKDDIGRQAWVLVVMGLENARYTLEITQINDEGTHISFIIRPDGS